MNAQVTIEFLTAYSWALLLVIVAAVAAYYFLSAIPQPAPECNFGNSFQCTTYQFIKNSDGTMKLTFQMTNTLGKTIWLYNKQQIITVQNIGKSGTNNYTGKCTGPADIVNRSDEILCVFNITDKEITPSVGKNVKFTVLLSYTNCDVSSIPSLCTNGTNRSLQGHITSSLELAPSIVTPRCKDGVCNAGENYTNCPWDCSPPRPTTLVITSTADCACNFLDKDTGVYEINVTVYDQLHVPMKGVPVVIFPQDIEGFEDTVIHITSYTITPSLPITDSNGLARANFSWHSCDCCFWSCYYPLFCLAATAGDVTVCWPRCAMLTGSDAQSLGCC